MNSHDSSMFTMVEAALKISRRNESILNKILGGLAVIGVLQTGVFAIGAWMTSNIVESAKSIHILEEQVCCLRDDVDKINSIIFKTPEWRPHESNVRKRAD